MTEKVPMTNTQTTLRKHLTTGNNSVTFLD